MARSLRSILFNNSGALRVRINGVFQNITRSAAVTAAPVNGVAAARTITPGTNNSIVYTAKTGGTAGNAITVTYVINGTGTTAVANLVGGNRVIVVAGSACTASTVITSVNANPTNAVVTATASGTVTGVITAVAATTLTGGVNATVASAGDTRVDSGFIYVAYADVAISSTAGWKKITLANL